MNPEKSLAENKGNDNHPKEKEMRFLSDQPLGADKEQEIRFGHLGLVDSLKNMVSTCPTPFTIGLFSKWGTGKTTVLRTLKDKFHASEIAVVAIDAWKHEGDALRRTFLQDTINQLHDKQGERQYLDEQVKLSENLRIPISRTFQSKITKSSIIWTLGIFITALIIVGVLIDRFSPNNFGTYMSTVSGGGLVVGILLWLLQRSVTTETVKRMTDRFQDPQEFESEFNEKIIGNVKAEKLLIIIDNLDRVSCDKAIELLSTIKTYLEQDKCVFLIACDAEAIKRHLEGLYGLTSEDSSGVSRFDGDEYLRKFFNSYLIIPDFIDTELYTYTEKLLDESNLHTDNRPDVAYVITKAFRDNPRQIKQFINTLISHLLLAEYREKSQELPKDTITKNVAYLAKDLIIRLQFPGYYALWTRGELQRDTSKELNDFLRATKPIDVENKRAFQYFKISEQEIEIPEIRELHLAFEDNNVGEASQIVNRFKTDRSKWPALNKDLSSFIGKNRGRGLLLFNIVSSILTTMKRLEIEFDKHFYHNIAELLDDDDQLGTQLQNFDPSIVFNEVLGRDETNRGEIIRRYSQLLGDPGSIKQGDRDSYIKALLQEFFEHIDWLNKTRRQEIGNAVTQHYCNYEILSIFMDKPDEQREFLSAETLKRFIGEISDSDVDDPKRFREKTDLLIEFDSIATGKNLSEILTQFTALLSTENNKPDREEKDLLLTCIEDTVDHYSDRIASLPEETINPFAEQVLRGVNALAQLERKRIFIPLCIWFADSITDPLQSQIKSVIDTFFKGADSTDLAFVFDRMHGTQKREELITSYNDALKQRALSDQSIFDYLYDIAAKDTRTDWLTTLIEVDHKRAVDKLEQLKHRVDDKKSVVSAIFTKISKLTPIMQRTELYAACNKMRCANDAGLKGKFVEHIKTLLKDATPEPQKMGLDLLREATYLSKTQRRDIAIDTIDWLAAMQPEATYQPSSAESVLLAWSLLTTPPKDKFLYYIFDILIRRGTSSQNISLGFHIAASIKPSLRYEDYPDYFEDVLSRAETTDDTNIKSSLVNGLNTLDPKTLNDKNKNFWQRVRNILSPEG